MTPMGTVRRGFFLLFSSAVAAYVLFFLLLALTKNRPELFYEVAVTSDQGEV